MNGGQVEQLGEPAELYDRPRTEFVAGFLGVSNLLRGTVTAPDRVRIETGDELSVPLAGRTGDVAIGVRPEKFRLGPPLEGENTLSGTVKETAYIGVSTQYIITTGAGDIVVYAQNRDGGRPLALESVAQLSWSPESTFVLDPLSRRRLRHEPFPDPQAAARARCARRCGPDPARLPRRLRRRRGRDGRDDGGGRRRLEAARRRAPVLELAALHRRRREDEEAADARAVHEGDGRQGQLLRGHQRQRLVLRQDPAPARRRASRSTATSSSSPTTRASPGS